MTHTLDLIPLDQKLQDLFHNSNPIAFARELNRGKRQGKTNREMAGMAGCGETHIRNMLMLLRLPQITQDRIEAGAPYRQFLPLLKKDKAAREEKAKLQKEATNDRAFERGARALAEWCGRLDLTGSYAERALIDVRAVILSAEQDQILKDSEVVWQGTPAMVFNANFPAGYAELRGVDKINAAIQCIASSLVALMPNAEARYNALEIALENPHLHGGW